MPLTWLPYESYEQSASVLDDETLRKQRVDVLQIMIALTKKQGKVLDSFIKDWQGYEFSLLYYQEAVCREWHLIRGHEDGILKMTSEIFWDHPWLVGDDEVAIPPWWVGEKSIHESHQAALIRLDPKRYKKIFPDCPDYPEIIKPNSLA